MKPSIGRIVHYVSFGTPGGEYGKECRAAIITEVPALLSEGPNDGSTVSLFVMNPTGQFFNREVTYHDGAETPGPADCPQSQYHGNPFRYCACGWSEAAHRGGSWHWPERVEG
jgi:hypothetical protein